MNNEAAGGWFLAGSSLGGAWKKIGGRKERQAHRTLGAGRKVDLFREIETGMGYGTRMAGMHGLYGSRPSLQSHWPSRQMGSSLQ